RHHHHTPHPETGAGHTVHIVHIHIPPGPYPSGIQAGTLPHTSGRTTEARVVRLGGEGEVGCDYELAQNAFRIPRLYNRCVLTGSIKSELQNTNVEEIA